MKAKLVVIANKGSVCSMGIGDKYKGGGGGWRLGGVRGDLKRDVLVWLNALYHWKINALLMVKPVKVFVNNHP